ncbi:hypothetical protein D9M68_743730 [compost metagenome]
MVKQKRLGETVCIMLVERKLPILVYLSSLLTISRRELGEYASLAIVQSGRIEAKF